MIKIIIRLWNYIRVKNAIIYAKNMHNQTGRIYYVIQIGKHIRVLSRTQTNYLVDAGVLRHCMRQAYFLQKYSLYYTKEVTYVS